MRIIGATLTALDQLADDFAAQVTAAIRSTLAGVARDLDASSTVDDLAVIKDRWRVKTERMLLDSLNAAYYHGVNHVRVPITRAVAQRRALTAAAPRPALQPPLPEPPPDPSLLDEFDFEIPRVANAASASFLESASNRLRAVGDDVWHVARSQLLDGFTAGEGVTDLRDRISAATELAAPSAEVIARTEVNGAANAGAIDQMRAVDVPAQKEWIATEDERTRPDHSAADGQQVGVDDTFDVGGESMDRPGDPSASAEQTVNCRCTMGFILDDGSIEDVPIDEGDGEDVTASAAVETSGMIALLPSEKDAARLAVDGGEPADQLHCTLLFLGDAAAWDQPARNALAANVESLFAGMSQVAGNVFGVNHWNPGGDSPSCVLAVGDGAPGALDAAHQAALAAADAAGASQLTPAQHSPWVAHICLMYSPDAATLQSSVAASGPLVFDRVRLAFAGDSVDYPLASPQEARQ